MYISEKCEWTPYGTNPELDKLVDSDDWRVREAVAQQGYGLDKLVNDKDHDVRKAIAEQCYGLDILIHDKDEDVRREVARHGYGLDKLITDEDGYVRREVAYYLKDHNYKSVFEWANDNGIDIDIDAWLNSNYRQREQLAKAGYHLDVLVNDKDYNIRIIVAEQGYSLDILVNDKNWYVRRAVAEQGYGLDILGNDEEGYVREAVARQGYGLDILITDIDSRYNVSREVKKYLREHNYRSIFDWAKDNGVDIDIDEWLHSYDRSKIEQVIKAGYHLDVLVNHEAWYVRNDLAEQGYYLDKLINDESYYVRKNVSDYLKDHGYKSIEAWAKANPNKVYSSSSNNNIETNNNLETADSIKDFVYKIDDSNTLKIESSYESCDAFFDDNSKESFESNEAIVILAVDTKIPLIKLEKALKDEKQVYKFIVDITNEDGDDFIVRSIISSKEKFNQLLESTINALNEYPQFSKYANDLENCIN